MTSPYDALGRIGPDELFPSTPARLLDCGHRIPEKPAYVFHDGEDWQTVSWGGYASQVWSAARSLVKLGVKTDEAICILGFNRPEWAIMANAAMLIGARPAGIYWTSSPEECAYILNHSEAPVLLVENEENVEALERIRPECPNLKTLIVMKGVKPSGDDLSWDDFLRLDAEGQCDDVVKARLKAIKPEHIGSLIYTSGTTGPPKAVMLSHGAIVWAADLLIRTFKGDQDSRGLSYLPMAHIAEQQASIHCHPIRGNPIWFARSMETIAADLLTVRPTVFFGVPRVWEKMAETLSARLAEATGFKKTLLEWAQRVNRRYHETSFGGPAPGLLTRLQKPLADLLVTRKIKVALGLDQARHLVSGAAPISTEILKFFSGLDMLLLEGYGQSETSAPVSANIPGSARLGSVGKVFDGMEHRISEKGELLVRGPNLYSGYMKDNEATSESFTQDGWLRTGDIVRQDADGFIYITGRIKDILITSGGKNITPANLETDLMNIPLVEHAVVAGDGRHYLTALITLSADTLAAVAEAQGLENAGPDHPDVRAMVQAGIDQMNERYARVENIRKFDILPAPLSVETGELTPTLKVRRNVVLSRNADRVEALYTGDTT